MEIKRATFIDQARHHKTAISIDILPIGSIEDKILSFVRDAVAKKFNLPTRILESLSIPEETFSPKRKQYDSKLLLNYMYGLCQDSCIGAQGKAKKVLAIIDKDLFTDGLNFVFGQAILGGCCGIISLARLRVDTNGQDNQKLFYERIEKEAVHELGHTFGLRHCPNPHCVMYLSSNIVDTDRKSSNFCKECGLPVI